MYKLSKSVDNAHDDAIWTACWTSKRRVLTASVDATLKLWDPTTLSSSEEGDGPVLTLTGHDLGVIDAAVAPDGVRAVSTGFDSVRVWDLDSGACTGSMASGSVEAWAVAIDPFAGTNFAVSSHAGGVGIYAVDSMEPVSSLEGAGKKFGLCLEYSPDGTKLAMGGNDGSVTLFDLASGSVSTTFTSHAKPVRALAFSPNNDILLSASDDMHVNMYDLMGGIFVSSTTAHSSWVLGLTYSPDAGNYATSSSDKQVKVWELNSREPVHTFAGHSDQVWSVAYDDTGSRLVSAGDDARIQIYDCPQTL